MLTYLLGVVIEYWRLLFILVSAPLWTLSFFDRGSAFAVTPDGLRCQSREQKEWHGCRATKGVQGKGGYYYEATVTDEGLCRVGWSTLQVYIIIFLVFTVVHESEVEFFNLCYYFNTLQ